MLSMGKPLSIYHVEIVPQQTSQISIVNVCFMEYFVFPNTLRNALIHLLIIHERRTQFHDYTGY
ncbi:hypothetical protein [Picobirnavirus sp.]|uniref:hypothetical protein n=1 Tax=Picobirnavirus sp. TaxID=1907787 RepID=UPI000C022063|nr:hypothetical protein [Picobirnavirus sp.]ATL73068.1 hypothetical protein [Picobirnavirus sp.]